MSLLSWVADRLILSPSNHAIDPAGKWQETVATADGPIEAWLGRFPEENNNDAFEVVLIKFPGTAGRAERAGVHPAEVWQRRAEIWTINPKGYGGSSRPASIKFFAATATATLNHVRLKYPDVPVVAVGNSLGCVSALYLAACAQVQAIMLRNPPPIHQLITTRPRYAAWNFGLSRWIADQVPVELDCVINSSNSPVPCLFVQSQQDRVVPVRYQNQIIDAYQGPKRVFQIRDADHHTLIAEEQRQEYFVVLQWLAEQIFRSDDGA